MAQSESELRNSPPSFSVAFTLKELQGALRQCALDFVEEWRNAEKIIVPERDKILREDGINYKMDEIIKTEARLDSNMEELASTARIQEESIIVQNESVCRLKEEKLQVYVKKYFIKDSSFNLEWKSGEVGKEIEELLEDASLKALRRGKDPAFLFKMMKHQDLRGNIVAGIVEEFLKGTFLKALRRRKDYAFLFDVLNCQVFRGDTVVGVPVNYEVTRCGLTTALQLEDFSILKRGLPPPPYME